MILEFSIGNFRSIKDVQHISFTATSVVSKNKEVDENNTFQATDKHRLLKSKMIYGANASGKSNFIRGLFVFLGIINSSVKSEDAIKAIEPFLLSTETEHEPTFFQLFFILEGVVYRYGFEATNNQIVSEWLFGTPKNREITYFIRDKQEVEVNHKFFKEGHRFHGSLNEDNPIFRTNSLFLSALAAFNAEVSKKITSFLARTIIISSIVDKWIKTRADEYLSKNEDNRIKLLNIMQKSDIGIYDLQAVEMTSSEDVSNGSKKEKTIVTTHKKYDHNQQPLQKQVIFHLDFHESEGSRRMYEVAPFVINALEKGTLLIIDEFDARLHPRISKQIIELFNSSKTNPKNAQLLVVTHDTNLLSAQLFRRDQICFVEKDKYEASHIYTLAEFKGVRNDASFEKDYLDGRYGAVPFLNGFSTIFEN